MTQPQIVTAAFAHPVALPRPPTAGHAPLAASSSPLFAAPCATPVAPRPRRAAVRAAQTAPPRPPRPGATPSQPSPSSRPPSDGSVVLPNAATLPGHALYPRPTGSCGRFAAEIQGHASIPAVFDAMAANPDMCDRPALTDAHHGERAELTFAQLRGQTVTAAAGLHALGLRHGDIVSFFSENSYRWGVLDQAVMRCGAAAAVRGVAAPVPELLYIHSDSTARALLVEDEATLKRLVTGGLGASDVDFIVLLFGDGATARALLPDAAIHTYDDVMRLGAESGQMQQAVVGRDDMASVLYTSGTTGNPKGVVLTHGNLLAQLENISLGSLDPEPGEVFLSVLPCWHVFERTAAYWCLSRGVHLIYSNKRSFRDDLVKYRPHILISVPRVFENLHGAIMGKLRKASATKKAIFNTFMTLSLAYIQARRRMRGHDISETAEVSAFARMGQAFLVMLLAPLYFLGNLLVWKKLRANLGGRLRICLSGGGSIAGYLEDFFEMAKIDICVGYGLTETAPVIANRFGERNVRGSTGRPMASAEVKIVDRETGLPVAEEGVQGELCVRGPSVFREYWRNAEATAKAFDQDGFFDTGDLAYVAPGGDIVISGRSKDLIVLSNGENIEPGPIEDALLASPLVDQVMLVGQDERALGALVVPQLDELEAAGVLTTAERKRLAAVRDAAMDRGTNGSGEAVAALAQCENELSAGGPLADAVAKEVAARNKERGNYSANDRVGPVRIVLTPFSVENGMMTQTLKVKKEIVSKHYASEIEALYRRN